MTRPSSVKRERESIFVTILSTHGPEAQTVTQGGKQSEVDLSLGRSIGRGIVENGGISDNHGIAAR